MYCSQAVQGYYQHEHKKHEGLLFDSIVFNFVIKRMTQRNCQVCNQQENVTNGVLL